MCTQANYAEKCGNENTNDVANMCTQANYAEKCGNENTK